MEMVVTTNLSQRDGYHTAPELNKHNAAIAAALGVKAQEGAYSMSELYESRITGFIELMNQATQKGLKAGWSKRHDDGELCFHGGWVITWIIAPSGKQARYHMEDTRPLPPELEVELGLTWNGEDETLEALKEL